MSELNVTVEKVVEILEHPNADRLEIAVIRGWNCVVAKDSLKKDDLVIYFPIDSILPSELEAFIFQDSKIKLDKSRVKTIKIRGAISQGLAVPYEKLITTFHKLRQYGVGDDIKSYLGVTKYEPPEKSPFTSKMGKQASKKQINPNFRKYTNINHWKNYPNAIDEDEIIVVTEKIHGTNFRAGYVPSIKSEWYKELWKKIKRIFTREKDKYPGYQYVFGSHNVQLQEKNSFNKKISQMNFERKKNVYEEISERYNLKELLHGGVVIYGEIYGDGIQNWKVVKMKDGGKATRWDNLCYQMLELKERMCFYNKLTKFKERICMNRGDKKERCLKYVDKEIKKTELLIAKIKQKITDIKSGKSERISFERK